MPEINQGVSRANYADRNPVTKALAYANSALAPAGNTVRATYTVPAGKKAYIQACSVGAGRKTAGGTPGLFQGVVRVAPLAGGNAQILTADLLTNAVGDRSDLATSGIGLLNAGDVLTLETYDDSVGGTVVISIAANIVEYDA